jgi:nucleoside-diphosphate-sugar epimerase
MREPAAALRARLLPASTGPVKPGAAARVSAVLRGALGRERFDRLRDRAASLRPAAGPLRPGRSDLELFAASPQIDIGKAERVLGWTPRIGFEQGLAMLREDFARRVPE